MPLLITEAEHKESRHMTQAETKRRDLVRYTVKTTGLLVLARVERVHRDHTVTVTAMQVLKDGKPDGFFLGHKYRLKARALSPAS